MIEGANFIDGCWVPAVSGRTFARHNPADPTDVVGIFPASGSADVAGAVDALEKAGVRKIVFIGPAPKWKGSLPSQMYDAWARASPFHTVPDRLGTGLEPLPAIDDGKLRGDLEARRVTYVSVIDFFCNAEGCLTHAPEGPTRLVTWDYGHLTTDGATLVAQKLAADRILP